MELLFIILRLPQSTVVQAQWLKFARENGINESLLKPSISLFCSAHFVASCFDRYTHTTHLKSNAVPTIKIKSVSYIITQYLFTFMPGTSAVYIYNAT